MPFYFSIYNLLFRCFRIAGIVGVFLSVVLFSCRSEPQTFADSLRKTKPDVALALSIHYIDSIAIHNPQQITTEIQQICRMFSARGLEHEAARIACHPYEIDPMEQPDIAGRLLTSTLLPGTKAPEINIGETAIQPGSDHKQTLVVFYESRCRSCQQMLNELIYNYDRYLQSGVRIITLSADTNPSLFQYYSEQLPWTDNLCDYLHYNSPAFIAYGVANVPTLFLVDEKGIVTQQVYTLQQLEGIIFARSISQDTGFGNIVTSKTAFQFRKEQFFFCYFVLLQKSDSLDIAVTLFFIFFYYIQL